MQALAEAGYRTAVLFSRVQSLGRHHETARGEEWPSAQLAAEVDRFELWTVNLGLFAPGHASLDYRVRDAESIRQTLLRFLSSLNEALDEVLEYFSDASKSADNVRDEALASERGGADADFSDDGFASEEGSDVDLLLDGIKDPINRLFKMGVWIRNPTSRFTSPKALGYTMVDTETGIDLLDMFKRYDYDYISSLFLEYRKLKAREDIPITEPVISDESKHEEAEYVWEPIRTVLAQYTHELSEDAEPFLVRRIAGANTRRRQLLAYWKVHRQKQGQQAAWNLRTLRPQPQFQGETPSLPAKETASSQAPADSGVLNLNSGLVAPQSVTTASQLDFSRLLAVRDDGQSSMSVSEYAASDWRPGKEVLGFPPPPTHPAGTKAFECPYCFTLCPGALLRERAWKAHLIHDLRPYICTYEHCRTPDQLYDSVEDWTKHELSSHGPESSVSNHAADHRIHCPVCLANSFEDSAELTTHLARHLERFSLFSLPRSAAEDDGSERTSQRSTGAYCNNSTRADIVDKMAHNGSASSGSTDSAEKDGTKVNNIMWIDYIKRLRDVLTSVDQPSRDSGDRTSNGPFDIEEPVRVALIDDGVDVISHNLRDPQTILGGKSFVTRESGDSGEESGLHQPFYASDLGHGTAMAKMINFVCPYAQLYVLRLDLRPNEDGSRRITAESAALAIEAAVNENVHIISMSWILRSPEDEEVDALKRLESAIMMAEKHRILMFCPVADTVFHPMDGSFPARASDRIFRIGAGGQLRGGFNRDGLSGPADFTLPGENVNLDDSSGSAARLSGSSVSTALAVGICALMLYCVQVRLSQAPAEEKDELRREFALIRSHERIKPVFEFMTSPDDKFIDVRRLFIFSEAELRASKDIRVLGTILYNIGGVICSVALEDLPGRN